MSKSIYETRIRERINEIERQMTELSSELADLRVAERVIRNLEGYPTEQTQINAPKTDTLFENNTKRNSAGKNTIAVEVIKKLHSHGPMESGAIYSYLQNSWRPDLNMNTLLSTLSRMKAANRIINKDRLWMLPQEEEALSSPQLDNASKPDVAESDSLNNVND